MVDQADGLRRRNPGRVRTETGWKLAGALQRAEIPVGTAPSPDLPAPPDPRAQAGARVLAVTSGKGGVGKTSLAVSLAVVLARSGLRVGVLDGDLGLANVDILLGLVPRYHLGHVLQEERRLSEVMLTGPAGIRVIPGGSGLSELANLSQWRFERFLRSLEELDRILDVLLIDTGAGIGRQVLSFLLACPEVLVVTTPEPTAIADAYGLIKVLAGWERTSRLYLVVNQAEDEQQAQAAAGRLTTAVRRFLNRELAVLGHIPKDDHVGRSVGEQVPFVLQYPTSPAARATLAIAGRLVDGGLGAGWSDGTVTGLGPGADGFRGVAWLLRRLAKLLG